MISLINQNRVKIVININNFLNLIEKRINNYEKNIFDVIIKQYTLIEIRNHKTDKEKKIIEKFSKRTLRSHRIIRIIFE